MNSLDSVLKDERVDLPNIIRFCRLQLQGSAAGRASHRNAQLSRSVIAGFILCAAGCPLRIPRCAKRICYAR